MPDTKIQLIALDLDGTLINSKKELTPANAAALSRAAASGIEIVPTTGRFFGGMPEAIRSLPYLHYAITVNGAQVYDILRDTGVAKAEMSAELAVRIMTFLDTLNVVYDCYQDNWGYMTASFQDHIEDYTGDPHYQKMVRELRKPVPELKAYLTELGHGVQKIQFFTKDQSLRMRMIQELPKMFPETAVSSASAFNVEINDQHANKGEAIHKLAEYLGMDITETAAFGDGLNDVPMLKEAGLGIAMANACPEAMAVCGMVTASCDEDGVARALERLGI